MTRAGRTTPKHAAHGRPDTPAAPDARADAGHSAQHAAPRHKASRRQRAARVVAPTVFALSAAGTVVAFQLSDDPVDPVEQSTASVASVDFAPRTADVSRSISRAVNRAAVRPAATAKPVVLEPTAVDHKFATALLTVITGPGTRHPEVRTVPTGEKVAVTGERFQGWAEVLIQREVSEDNGKRDTARTETVVRWVNADYLADRKPAPPEPEPEPVVEAESEDTSSESTTTTGLSTAPCADGSTIESGITSTAVQLYRAVCAAFPALTTYGGYDPHGEHIDGRAIDFMASGSLGQAVADYVLANAGALGVRDIIWAQQIWTPDRAAEGWRWMEDRGDPTANHYDHVHVAVY